MVKTVHDVRKICLEMTLCIYACFIEFYVLIFDVIYVRGPNLIYEHVQVLNVWGNIPMDNPRVIEEGPFMSAYDCPTQLKPRRQSTHSGSVDAP